jgi:hypothetical protein
MLNNIVVRLNQWEEVIMEGRGRREERGRNREFPIAV